MAKKLEDFTTDRLRKRKKITVILIWLLVIVGVLSLLALLYDLIWGNGTDMQIVAPILVCLVFALFMAQELKKINKELSERNKQADDKMPQ